DPRSGGQRELHGPPVEGLGRDHDHLHDRSLVPDTGHPVVDRAVGAGRVGATGTAGTAGGSGAAEGREEGVVGTGGLVVLVPQVGVAVAGEGVGDPRAAVAHPPDRDAHAAVHAHAGRGDGRVVLGLLGEFVLVGGQGDAHVQFGDGHLQAQVHEALHVLCHVGGNLADDEVALQADPVQRHALVQQVAGEAVQGVALRVEALDVVVVDVELRVGVGGVGGAQGLRDVVGADLAVEDRVPQAAVLVERFVDHVPTGDVPGVAADGGGDVAAHLVQQFTGGEVGVLHPVGELVVPDEGVAVDLLAVLLGEGDHAVGRTPVVVSPGGLQGAPLHLVAGGDTAELPRRDLGVFRAQSFGCGTEAG